MATSPHPLLQNAPLTVGALRELADLDLEVGPRDTDWVELRLDALGSDPRVEAFATSCPLPLLLTARHPAEGGEGDRSVGEREDLLRGLLPHATAVDLELCSLDELPELWNDARKLLRVASVHDFEQTPPLESLRDKIAAAHAAGADVAKLAFRIREPEDLNVIIALFESPSPLPLSVMGMGPLAPSSRLLAAQLGSVLNYGFLGGKPTSPGQWPAPQLKRVLAASQE